MERTRKRPGSEKKWCGTHTHKPVGEWDKTAKGMMLNFAESGHPAFRATSALEKGELTSKEERNQYTSTEGEETVELILADFQLFSVNRLSIYGAVADLCNRLAKVSPSAGKLAEFANSRNQTEGEICESLVIPTEIANANTVSQSSTSLAQGDLLQEYERKFAEILDDQKLLKLCSDACFFEIAKEIGKGQFFVTLNEEEGPD